MVITNLLARPLQHAWMRYHVLYFTFILGMFAAPLLAQEQNKSVAEERASGAKELAQRAIERAEHSQEIALRAEVVAQEALSASSSALELSDRRFEAIQFLLYVVTGITGVFVVITSVFETVRRRTEQSRFEQLLVRQGRIDDIQIDLGKKVLGKFDESFQSQIDNVSKLGGFLDKAIGKFDESFKSQIDSISKLGSVVDLVSKTFEIQNRASEEQIALIKRVEELTNIVTKQRAAYLIQFEKLHEDLSSFKNLSRMEWTRISVEEQNLIARATKI